MKESSNTELLERTRGGAALDAIRRAAEAGSAYLVGGAVRDALLGRPLGDLDVAIEGDLEPVLDALGVEVRSHERFGTASVVVGGTRVDLARTRRERYPRPGALPEVAPAPIRADLARRDFTANAIALPLDGEPILIDPYDGVSDIDARLLRVIHPDSFREDPTRALRAARYAAELGFELAPETAELIADVDLGTVSEDRVRADLLRLAAGDEAVRGFRLLARWGLVPLSSERLGVLAAAAELQRTEPWSGLVGREELLLAAATGERTAEAEALAGLEPDAPSEGHAAARRHDDLTLALARARGARWLDRHVTEWRRVKLAIDGDDLRAAGVEQGPAIGAGLRAALAARLDGRIPADREAELETALAAIRKAG